MICTNCGKENSQGNWVCGGCGETLSAGGSASAPGYDPNSAFPNATYSSPVDSSSSGRPAAATGNDAGITKWLLLLAVVFIGGFSGWYFFLHNSNRKLDTPAGTMEAYMTAINDGDCGTMFDLSANTDGEARSEAVSACSRFVDIINFSVDDFNLIEETVDQDAATVVFEVDLEMAGSSVTQEMTAELVKVEGKWKVTSSILI